MSFTENVKKTVVPIVANTATAAAVVVGGASLAAKGVGTAVKAALPTTLKKQVTAGAAAVVAVPAAAGVIVGSPKKSLEVIGNAPSNVANFATNIFTTAKTPSLSNIKTTIAENPLLSAATIAIPSIALTKGLAGVLITEKALSGNDTGIIGANDFVPKDLDNSLPSQTTIPSKSLDTNTSTPKIPETTTITTGNGLTKAKKRKKKSILPMNISQKVNVLVNNKSYSVNRKIFKQQ